VKAKPLSIRHRFILLQALTFALAIWLLAGALYINLRIRREMEEPLCDLHAALALHAEMDAAQQAVLLSAANAYFHPGEASGEEFRSAARKLPKLLARYFSLQLSPEERRALENIQPLQQRLLEYASLPPFPDSRAREEFSRFREVGEINRQVDLIQCNLAQAHLRRLEATTERLHEYTRRLYLLLGVFGLFATLALLQFRRFHRREIWRPLDELRRMVTEIRRGNLDVRGKMPGSIEFGALVKGFSEMAGELGEMRDSLEQKVRERTAELENTQHELAQTAKLSSLGQLVSGVAHEINNPLTSILGFSELALARTQLDPGLRIQLQTIRDEAVRVKNLVVSLSTFARRGTQRTARLDLRQALDRLVNLRRYQLGANNIELHFDRPPGPVWVEGDLDLLVQVIFNLVLNSEQAILCCRTRGDIWLGCGVEAGRAWATVRDNGAGMSPFVRERIFDPFFTTKPIGQGTGLGLSISHGIIQQHRGSISAHSVEGQGANMRIVLPVADPPKSAENEPAHSEAAAMENRDAWPGPLALVIDDEPAISQLVGQFLESRGWRAVILNDSTAVEASLAEQPFALVICDLKMPGMNGLDVLRLLRHKQPKLAQRFLLMTGNLADAEQMQNVELAGIPILRKPFALSRLAESLDALLKNQD
jgi:signal transduction histidine kinase/ActR/RegA family two-component response regulator